MSAIERYLQRGSKSVEGWLRPEAAMVIAELAREQTISGAVAEIGVHHGKLFILLSLCRNPGESAVAIDLFEDQARNIDHSGAGDRAKFEQNLARLDPNASSVTVRSRDSTTLTTEEMLELGDGKFRMFSVDGGHTAAITTNDLSISSSVLEPGGIIILDDYFNVSWPGVSEGANRFLMSRPSVVPFAAGHGKMYFTHPPYVDEYREVTRAVARRRNWRLTEQPFFDHPLMIVETRQRPSIPVRSARWIRANPLGRRLTNPMVHWLRDRKKSAA